MIHFECFNKSAARSFLCSVNLQNSPKLQPTDVTSMKNIEGQNVTMRIVTEQSIKKLMLPDLTCFDHRGNC